MGQIIAKVVVAKAIYSIDRPFDYLVPKELIPSLATGMRVLVSFGRGDRGSDGLVLAIEEVKHYDRALKSIIAQLDETPVLNQEAIRLAIWMREFYYCSSYDCIRAMLPAGLFFALQDSLVLSIEEEEALNRTQSTKQAHELVKYLIHWGGQGDLQQIRIAFGTKDPNTAIRFLLNENIVTMEHNAKRNVGDKTDILVTLLVSPEDALNHVMPQKRRSPIRFAVIEFLCQYGEGTQKEISYFTGADKKTFKSLEKSGLVLLESYELLRSPHKEEVLPAPKPILNEEQQNVLEGLQELTDNQTPAAALLYGITGSGKTQVYLALIHKLLEQGKTALVLVPEISLTPQFLRIFSAQFGDNIAILHSGLRVGERYDEWKRVKRGEASVVLGTRSAVFAPLENIGVIIIDEEQEQSYKSDMAPRYHARDIAKFRCTKHNALLLLGSATPSVDSMYRAKVGIYHLFTLKNRFNQENLPEVSIVDMKQELKNRNYSTISRLLLEEIKQNEKTQEQTILFLNRRGSNRMLLCTDCGDVPECPNCSVHLTYHSANNRLMCHYCSYSIPKPEFCPSCNGSLQFLGVGTQQVEENLHDYMLKNKVIRMDTDTISAANSHQEVLSKFEKEKIPVLIGTQMVAKGLDFPNVTLVGVVSGDMSLFVNDLWAGERTFSLITQVVGRAGRGGKKGRAIIQTYTPDHDIILAAANQDYDSFFTSEIELRQLRKYPPFRDMIVIAASGPQESQVLKAMGKIRGGLEYGITRNRETVQILGPVPAPVLKLNNRYRYRITLMAEHTKALRELLSHLLTCALKDKENQSVSIYIDRLVH